MDGLNPIREQIFMGMGTHSLAYIGRLHMQLGKALDILNGIQQPPSPHESEESCKQWEQDFENGQMDVELIAKEIFVALTGKLVVESKPVKKRSGS